jgi:UDP-glucose 4-epimerase
MRLLITGATGFIGGSLVDLLSPHHELVCLISDRGRAKPYPNVVWVEQDLGKPFDGKKVPVPIDGIIHLAQSRHYREFPERSWDIFDVNIRSTFSLLEYGRKVGIQKFIYASSGGIYGYSYEKFVETDSTTPINFYLTSKYCAELLIGNYEPFFATAVFRFFFVYGAGQEGMLIPRLLSSIRQGEPVVVFGKDGVRINPIHIRDAVKVFPPSLDSPVTGVFNVAGDEIVSIKELAEVIGGLMERSPRFVYERGTISGDIIGDNSRMKSVLGVIPEVSLRQGISEMMESVKKTR